MAMKFREPRCLLCKKRSIHIIEGLYGFYQTMQCIVLMKSLFFWPYIPIFFLSYIPIGSINLFGGHSFIALIHCELVNRMNVCACVSPMCTNAIGSFKWKGLPLKNSTCSHSNHLNQMYYSCWACKYTIPNGTNI